MDPHPPYTTWQALEGFRAMCSSEGIIPALEPSHAVYATMELAKKMGKEQIVLLNLCGRG